MDYTIVKTEGTGLLRTVTYSCPKHGEFTIKKLFKKNGESVGPTVVCPACIKEWREEHEEEIEAQRRLEMARIEELERAAERDRHERELKRALQNSNIPREYRNVDLSAIAFEEKGNEETLRQVRLYAEKFDELKESGVGLFLYGETGTGKTHLACALLHSLMPKVRGIYAMTWQIIRAVKAAGFQDDPLEPLILAPLLVIDEIGVQHGSKFEETALYPLIDSRVAERRPTIFISNVQPDTKDLARREETVRGMLGERLWDRVQYRSIFLPLHGASVRKRYRSVDELLEASN